MSRNAIRADVCADQAALIEQLRSDAGAVMLTEEALAVADISSLGTWVATQPAWSDIPFIVLANGAVERGPATRPQPAFEVRSVAGRVQVRRDEERSLRLNPAT